MITYQPWPGNNYFRIWQVTLSKSFKFIPKTWIDFRAWDFFAPHKNSKGNIPSPRLGSALQYLLSFSGFSEVKVLWRVLMNQCALWLPYALYVEKMRNKLSRTYYCYWVPGVGIFTISSFFLRVQNYYICMVTKKCVKWKSIFYFYQY